MEKRDKWEEAIRAKLEHFESTPDPSDWEAIAHRLSDKTPVIRMKSQRWAYWAAAAIVLLLLPTMVSGGARHRDRRRAEKYRSGNIRISDKTTSRQGRCAGRDREDG